MGLIVATVSLVMLCSCGHRYQMHNKDKHICGTSEEGLYQMGSNDYEETIKKHRRKQFLFDLRIPILYSITLVGVQHFSGHWCIAISAVAAIALVRNK